MVNEPLISIPEAAKLLPVPVPAPTIHSWARRGVMGIRLETRHVGGRCFTSSEALQRFLKAVEEERGSRIAEAVS